MNLYGPQFYDDDQLAEEIKQLIQARKETMRGDTAAFKSVAGEGRRVEFASTATSRKALDVEIRNAMTEARKRGLPIAEGTGGSAIAVEYLP